MKKVKFFLAATAMITVVGGALAFKAHKNDPDLFVCTNNKCALSTEYTDVPNGNAITPPVQLYTSSSTTGATCGTAGCEKISTSLPVYINQ